jgi:hypothetical protein
MVEHHVWLVGEMIGAAGGLDEAALDRNIEMSVEGFDADLSIRHLLDRLIWQMEMWLAAVDDQPFEVPPCEARRCRFASFASGTPTRVHVSSRSCIGCTRTAGSTRRSSTPCASRPAYSPTAAWFPTC